MSASKPTQHAQKRAPRPFATARTLYGQAFDHRSFDDVADAMGDWSRLSPTERSFAVGHLLYLNLQTQETQRWLLEEIADTLHDLDDTLQDLADELYVEDRHEDFDEDEEEGEEPVDDGQADDLPEDDLQPEDEQEEDGADLPDPEALSGTTHLIDTDDEVFEDGRRDGDPLPVRSGSSEELAPAMDVPAAEDNGCSVAPDTGDAAPTPSLNTKGPAHD